MIMYVFLFHAEAPFGPFSILSTTISEAIAVPARLEQVESDAFPYATSKRPAWLMPHPQLPAEV